MASQPLFKFAFFVLLILAVVFEIFADTLLKKWSLSNKNVLLVIGLVVYLVGTVFWAFSLKYEYLSKAVSVFTVLNLIAVVLVGLIYFKEDLSLLNKIGIGLGIVSVILLEV